MPNFRPVNCSSSLDHNPNTDFTFAIKPDVAVYQASVDPDVRTDSSLAELFIEFKWCNEDDPFCDPYYVTADGKTGKSFLKKSFLKDTKKATDTLGQITSYAAIQLGSQFRTHIFSVLIVRDLARIIRWDRSGAIVTEAIFYNQSSLLVDFFRRYSQAPPEMHGIDQSVSDPTPEEKNVARRALVLGNDIPLVKLKIPSTGGCAPRYFITTTPRAAIYSPPGRATRGFRAYDISQAAICFLKDSWRVDLPDIQAEGLTYEALKKANVRNVPESVAYGDISTTKYHATKTLTYAKETWACSNFDHLIPHRHYRLALNVVGRSLLAFDSSYEMVAAVRDAIVGRFNRPFADEQY